MGQYPTPECPVLFYSRNNYAFFEKLVFIPAFCIKFKKYAKSYCQSGYIL